MKLFATLSATAITTATLLAASAAQADTLTVREGLNGYAGTQDTWFSERSTGGENAGFPESTYIRTALWSGANQQGLLQFVGLENMLVPGGTINSATLQLTVPSDITFSDGETNAVHQMLVAWEETDTYGSAPWAGGATPQIDLDDVEAASIAVADSNAFATDDIIPQGAVLTFDVTSIVQAWADGEANYGFLFQSLGLAGGGGLFMASSEYDGADGEAARPTLIIDGDVVPEPGSLALLGLGGLAILRRRR
ncbi:MAG: DNRLRE domain-containing protein [Phycisphaerales bacterium JB063]